MPLKSFIALLLNFALVSSSLGSSFEPGPWKEEIENLHKLNESFYNICFDDKGDFLKDHIISDGKEHIDCNEQALALDKHHSALKKNIETYPQGNLGPLSCNISNDFGSVLGPEDALAKLSEKMNVNKCQKENDSECAQGLVCNAMSSFMSGPIGMGASISILEKSERLYQKLGLGAQSSKAIQALKTCAKRSSGGDCALNLMRGVWDSLYTTVVGMWELLKFGYKKVKQGANYIVDSIGSWFSDVEDATSDKMLAAQNVDDGMLDKFLEDPLQFVSDLAMTVYKAIVQAAKDHYGCEKWSGAPYVSKCLKPMSNWGCATCNQKMNVICGVGGFVVGEIVTAYLTGGATAAVEVAGKSATRLGSKALGRVARALKFIPKADEAIEVAAKAGKFATGMGKFLGRNALVSWRKLEHAFSFKEVAKAAKKVRLDLVKGVKVVKKNKIYKGTAKVAEIGFSPFKTYLHLMDDAFNAGFYQTHKALRSGQKALRLSTISNLEKTIKSGLDANAKVSPKALASDYAKVILRNNASDAAQTQKAAKEIHEVWMRHYAHKKDSLPELFVPYEKLSAQDKLKTVETLKEALKSRGSREFNRDHFKKYILNLEVELAGEKFFLFVSKDNRLADYVNRGELEAAAMEAFKFISIDSKMRKALGLSNAARFKDLSSQEKARLMELIKKNK